MSPRTSSAGIAAVRTAAASTAVIVGSALAAGTATLPASATLEFLGGTTPTAWLLRRAEQLLAERFGLVDRVLFGAGEEAECKP
jgi:hypothetical protein